MTLEEIKESLRTKERTAIKEAIEFKKAQFKRADAVTLDFTTETPVIKGLSTSKDGDTDTVIKRTIIGNTYNWLDSHGDVHLKDTFKKSINERGEKGKIWHLHDHIQQRTAKVGRPQKVYQQEVKWSDLGVSKNGTTQVVMMDTNIMKSYNSMMFEQYKDGEVDQHSVGMYYVKIDLAVNDSEFKEEFEEWNNSIDKIGNKAKAEEMGYFWAVKEAKLIEISAVLEGSNELTPTIEAKDNEPSADTQKQEPPKGTQNDNGKDSLDIYTFI